MQRHITEFLGPIFAKEVIEIARRLRYYLCRTAFGAFLAIVMWIAWEEWRPRSGGSSANVDARFASMVFIASSYVQYWSVYLLLPAFLCGVVAGEREEHTLDLLFITPLSDREIVLGKLFSRVAAMVCLILCAVPVVSLLMLFGGISPESIWRVLAATMLAILFAGSYAIYFSVITRSPMEAMARTYVAFFMWLAGLAILAWGVDQLYRTNLGTAIADVIDFCRPVYLIYPLASFWGAVRDTELATLNLVYGVWAWPATFVFPTLWSILLLWRAIRRLRQVPAPRMHWAKRLGALSFWKRSSAQAQATIARRPRSANTWFGFGRPIVNPLWLRARLARVYDRAGSIGRLQWLGWFIIIIGLVITAIYSPRDLTENNGCNVAFLAPTWGILGLVTALVAGHSLIGDRRRGFLEQIIVTPLTGREIVDGSFLALWEHLRKLFWLPLALSVFFCITGASPLGGSLMSMLTGALFSLVIVWQGIACSLAARTTAGAVIATFVLPLTAVFILPMSAMSFREDHAVPLWIMVGVFFAVSSVWVWAKLSAGSVGSYMTALHLALIAIAQCWTRSNDDPGREFPMFAMHPILMTVVPLVNVERGYQNLWTRYGVIMELCYWAGLAMNIALIRLWLIRHFDRLVGRMGTSQPLTARRTQPRPSSNHKYST